MFVVKEGSLVNSDYQITPSDKGLTFSQTTVFGAESNFVLLSPRGRPTSIDLKPDTVRTENKNCLSHVNSGGLEASFHKVNWWSFHFVTWRPENGCSQFVAAEKLLGHSTSTSNVQIFSSWEPKTSSSGC